jgi:hypothetical protein
MADSSDTEALIVEEVVGSMTTTANKSAAGKAGIARRLAIEHHCPGLPEPERYVVRA